MTDANVFDDTTTFDTTTVFEEPVMEVITDRQSDI